MLVEQAQQRHRMPHSFSDRVADELKFQHKLVLVFIRQLYYGMQLEAAASTW